MSKVKGGLGRGLSALIPTAPQAEPRPGERTARPSEAKDGGISHIPVAKIRPNPFQPRADFDPQALDELKESIRQNGIIQPVTVRQTPDGAYELISGERRIRASAEIGLTSVPAYIREVRNNEEMLELALIENLQREHLNPIEIAISYQRLIDDVRLAPEEVAQRVSKDRSTVVNFLRLLKLPSRIQDAVRKNDLSMGHARALISVTNENMQLVLFDQIMKRGLNVRQVEKLVRDVGRKSAKKTRTASPRTAQEIGTTVASIAERIQQILATRVKIHEHGNGKGDIVVEYYSPDDLERLFDLILGIERRS